MNLTPEERERVKALDAAATPGPLVVNDDNDGEFSIVAPDETIVGYTTTNDPREHVGSRVGVLQASANAKLMALARTLLPRAMAQIEAMTAEAAKVATHGGSTCGVFHSAWVNTELAVRQYHEENLTLRADRDRLAQENTELHTANDTYGRATASALARVTQFEKENAALKAACAADLTTTLAGMTCGTCRHFAQVHVTNTGKEFCSVNHNYWAASESCSRHALPLTTEGTTT